jgi:pectinesterase
VRSRRREEVEVQATWCSNRWAATAGAILALASGRGVAAEDAPPDARTVVVAADGGGDYRTVQEAVDAVPAGNAGRVLIRIRPGIYKGRIVVPPGKPFISFVGEEAGRTILTYDWNAHHVGPDGKEVGSGGSTSTMINGHDFVAEGVTFENAAGDTGQALAIFADADRLVFRKCRFLGWQDTIYAGGGRQYYDRCDIQGRVDFIFGGATAVFDHCTIHSKNGGFVTAASTAQGQPFGYVFLDCTLTGEGDPAALGRPWQPYAAVAYVRCRMGAHIVPEGWNNWGNPGNEKTARYSEYKCTGPGADRSRRVPWSRELPDEEAAGYTIRDILGGAEGWDPKSTVTAQRPTDRAPPASP